MLNLVYGNILENISDIIGTNMKTKTITGDTYYWALLCKCGTGKNKFLICGVYPSKKEALEVDKLIKGCPAAPHKIKKCKVKIFIK